MCFCLGGPDRLRFAAFVVGNAAPKSWKRVKVAIRFRLLSLLPSSPSKSTADAKGSEGGGGGGEGKTPNLPGKLEIYVGLNPKIDGINYSLGL